MPNILIKSLWIFFGSLSLALGIIGIFIPLLPTTPFLLLTAACYVRGSERLYQWLLNNRWFGNYIKNFREGKGVPIRTKIVAILLLWLMIGYSVIVIVTDYILRGILCIIAFAVSIHIMRLPTLRIRSLKSRID